MKKSFVVILTLFITALALQAQVGAVATQDSIVFEKTTYDYGTIAYGGDGTCEFVFLNKGAAPLVLTNVHASCGCTIPEWPKEPISTGKTGVIKVKYNTNLTGPFRKSISVSSNAANSLVSLVITGSVTPQ